jgi:hypothetical protein
MPFDQQVIDAATAQHRCQNTGGRADASSERRYLSSNAASAALRDGAQMLNSQHTINTAEATQYRADFRLA